MDRRSSRYYLFYSGGDLQGDYAMGYAVRHRAAGPFAKSAGEPTPEGHRERHRPRRRVGPWRLAPTGADQMIYHARSAPASASDAAPRPAVWNDAASPATVAVSGPTTTPQPLP